MFRSKNLKASLTKNVMDSLPAVSYVLRTPSTLDSFMHVERHLDSENVSIRIHDDVYMLFNQDRLDRMTKEALITYINGNIQNSDSLRSLRSKMSDSQLLKFIKSRYIQAPSDLQQWSKYLEMMADSELQNIRDAADVSVPSTGDSVDSSSLDSTGSSE